MKECSRRPYKVNVSINTVNEKTIDKAISELNKMKLEYAENCQPEEIDFEPKRGKKGRRMKDWQQ